VLDVNVLTRPPQTPVRPRAVAQAPRRWPRRLVVTASVVVVIVVSVATAWLANIEPLATGPAAYAITGRGLDVTLRRIDALGTRGTVQSVAMRPNMTFRYRFSIQNTGRLPVTIVDAGSPQPQGISTKVVSANLSTGPSPGSSGFGPFAPFRLAPGQVAALTMQVHVAADVCTAKGTGSLWYEEPVTYRVLGITRHANVPTGTEIRLEGTAATAC
jgi:hypothetical protein